MEYEKRFHKLQYKFGVLNVKAGQTDENDIYGNSKLHRLNLDEMSADFLEFLGVLGETVELRGWQKYPGELDTGELSATGKTSVYTNFMHFEIMFHVAPMLPFQVLSALMSRRTIYSEWSASDISAMTLSLSFFWNQITLNLLIL